jgi:cyclic-di-GMP-binding protein
MPSFDVVSEADPHEVQNAFDQAEREIRQRYDFQGTSATLTRTDAGFKMSANSQDRVEAVYLVLVDKFVKRKLSLKFLDKGTAAPGGGSTWNLEVTLKKGVDKENAKKIVAIIKNEKTLKVTPAIQGDSVRITGKKRDDLQEAIARLKQEELPLALTYENFRD